MKDLKQELQKLPKYYGKIHYSEKNPMVSLKDVETMLIENLNNLGALNNLDTLKGLECSQPYNL